MRIILILIFFFTSFMNGVAQEWNWAMRFGGVESESLGAMRLGASGALIIAGNYNSELTLGNTTFQAIAEADAYLAKLDDTGSVLWAKSAGSNDNDVSIDVEEDTEGNLLWLGQYWVSAVFENDTIHSGPNAKAYFLAKYDPEGTLLWVNTINGTTTKVASDLVLDTEDNIYLTGYYSDNLLIGDTTLVAQAEEDAFIAKYDAQGNLSWGRTYGSSGIIRPQLIDRSPEGKLVVAGNLTGSITFGIDVLNSVSTDFDLFVASFDDLGEAEWGRIGTGVFDNLATSVTIDEEGGIFVGGHLTGVLNIEGVELSTPGFEDNIFALRLDKDGGVLWGRALANDQFNDSSFSFDITLNGEQLIMIGHYVGSLIIDDLSIEAESALEGYIAVFDVQNGMVENLSGIRGTMQTSSTEVEVDDLGQLYVGGTYLGTALFGNIALESAGSTDCFVAQASSLFTNIDFPNISSTSPVIFPNPVNQQLRVLTDEPEFTIILFDYLGREVLVAKNEVRLDVKHLSPGTYWLSYSDRTQYSVQTFIKL